MISICHCRILRLLCYIYILLSFSIMLTIFFLQASQREVRIIYGFKLGRCVFIYSPSSNWLSLHSGRHISYLTPIVLILFVIDSIFRTFRASVSDRFMFLSEDVFQLQPSSQKAGMKVNSYFQNFLTCFCLEKKTNPCHSF